MTRSTTGAPVHLHPPPALLGHGRCGRTGRQPAHAQGMRPLAILPDNITTDHLSPSNAILMNSAAVSTCTRWGVPGGRLQLHATHRGDHLTAMRATFAEPNAEERDGAGDGRPAGSLARGAEGQVVRMWEAMETYYDRKQPLIIVAGADYGQGSSRDWAAKGVRLAGVEADCGRRLRAHPPHQPDRHGRDAAGVKARHQPPDAEPWTAPRPMTWKATQTPAPT